MRMFLYSTEEAQGEGVPLGHGHSLKKWYTGKSNYARRNVYLRTNVIPLKLLPLVSQLKSDPVALASQLESYPDALVVEVL